MPTRPAQNISPEQRVIAEYLGMEKDLDLILGKIEGNKDAPAQGLKEAAQYVRNELPKQSALYHSSLSCIGNKYDCVAQTELENTGKSLCEAQTKAGRAQNFYQQIYKALSKNTKATKSDWENLAETMLCQIKSLNSIYGKLGQEALRWTAGRIALSTLDEKCNEILGLGLDSGDSELQSLGARFLDTREVVYKKLHAMEQIKNGIEDVYKSYEQACKKAKIAALPLQANHRIFEYVASAVASDGIAKTAYDVGEPVYQAAKASARKKKTKAEPKTDSKTKLRVGIGAEIEIEAGKKTPDPAAPAAPAPGSEKPAS